MKCHPNGAKIAIFLLKNHKNFLAAGGFSPQTPVYDMFKLHQFTQHSALMIYFLNNDILAVGSSPLPPLQNSGGAPDHVVSVHGLP